MNSSEYIKVNIDQIDFNDRSYIFTFESPLFQLVASINKVGLIHPPILEQKENHTFRIVSGLKRILALRHLKKDLFDAQVYYAKSEKPDIDLFLLNLYENIGTRNLNSIEKAVVIHKLINLFYFSEEKVRIEILPLLDLGVNKVVLERYLKLVLLEDNIKISVAEDFISINIAIALLERQSFERQAIFNFFQKLRLGKNRQKEFLGLFQELSEITGQSYTQILENIEIQDVLSDNKITLPRKIDRIKEILRKIRYPIFTEVNEKFQTLKKQLNLPPNIMLRPPPFFEGEKYTIEFKFKNQSEYKKVVEILNSIADQNQFDNLENLV